MKENLSIVKSILNRDSMNSGVRRKVNEEVMWMWVVLGQRNSSFVLGGLDD